MTMKQPRAPGLQNIRELRLMILACSALRDSAVLGQKLPSPFTTRRDGADQGSP